MDIHEEYWLRKSVKQPMIKYVDKGNLILKAKNKKSDWAWLHVNITSFVDPNHHQSPLKYNFVVSANPQLYASQDMNHFAQQSKMIQDENFEWDQYEVNLVEWAKKHSNDYQAIPSKDAVVVAWEIFVTNYDSWIAHFVPYRIQDMIYLTISDEPQSERLAHIKSVEDFLKEKFERVFICWKSIKGSIEQKNYADWFAKIINDMAA